MKPKEEFTHLASMHNIPCYYNIHTEEIQGTNWFWDKVLDFVIWLEFEFAITEEGFPILLKKKLDHV